MRKFAICTAALLLGLLPGCMDSLSNQGKRDPNTIIGKKTDDIKEFDPKARQEVSDSKVRADDPILAPLQAYGPMVEQISSMEIDHAVDLYEAEHGHYPKDYNEFMTGVVKANHIKLAVLPGHAKYMYDVPNHKLKIVREIPADPNAAPAAAANPSATPPAAAANQPAAPADDK